MRRQGEGTRSKRHLVSRARTASLWRMDCAAWVLMDDGCVAAEYPITVTGTCHVLALPPTMFSLLGASFRGPHDGAMVNKRVDNNAVAGILKAVNADWDDLVLYQVIDVPSGTSTPP